jgi:hypothetical protein
MLSIPSYGDSMKSWKFLSIVLASLNEARLSSGIARMDIVLDLTSQPPAGALRVPDGLNVTHVLHDPSVRLALAGQYRPRYVKALAANGYDYYGMLDNDLNITTAALDALCVWQGRLAGTNLMPGVLRWETRDEGDVDMKRLKLLNDQGLCCPPHLGGVINLAGRRLIVPTNPMQGAWFLPASRLQCVLGKLASSSRDALSDWRAVPRDQPLEFHESLWLVPWLIKVVPLDDFDDLLVHHLSNRYVRTTKMNFATSNALRNAAMGFSGFDPVTLPGPKRCGTGCRAALRNKSLTMSLGWANWAL